MQVGKIGRQAPEAPGLLIPAVPEPSVTTLQPMQPSPPPPLAALAQEALRNLQAFLMEVQAHPLPEALEAHVEACIALGQHCISIGCLICQHPTIHEAVLGYPPVPEAPPPEPQAAPPTPKRTPAKVKRTMAKVKRRTPKGTLRARVEQCAEQLGWFRCADMARELDKGQRDVRRMLRRLVSEGKLQRDEPSRRYRSIPQAPQQP